MSRKKVKLAYIQNHPTRNLTFKKRKKGFMKKMSEITTLCDVEACAVVYGQNDTQPEVWPSPSGVQSTYAKFRTMPSMEQTKKQLNMEAFLRQQIEKAKDQLRKQKKENREKEMSILMSQCLTGRSLQDLNMGDLNDLGWVVDHKVEEINRKVQKVQEELAQNENNHVQVVPTPPPPPPATSGRIMHMQQAQSAAPMGVMTPQDQQPQEQMAGLGANTGDEFLQFGS
ncbi:agamous-like MADS-box protein AGL80 [Pyrus x bretschneideri]|uniref:agamous-like MADS-box protein AGL80 n=1 Tax=Pyrus x bretschneideri TaxID=225117 RepID=UPI000510A45A|nr:agamous-like MADS-box protein AGL80 [Pyrus x bretschneideri]